jgi:hypothetical protein
LRIVHIITLEGPPEEVYPATKDLKTHISGLKDAFEKNGMTVLHEYSADGNGLSGGSRMSKLLNLAGKGVKSGFDYMFKEEKEDGAKTA